MKLSEAREKAHREITTAIRRGILQRPLQCDFCNIPCKPHAHHDDDNNPLKINWLCNKCHHKRHKELRAIIKKELESVYKAAICISKALPRHFPDHI